MEYQPPSFGQQPQQPPTESYRYAPGGHPMGATAPIPVVAPKKKSNTLRVILATVGAIAVICCGGAIGSAFLNTDNPDTAKKRAAAPIAVQTTAGTPTATAATEETETPVEPVEDAPETLGMKPGETAIITTDDGTIEVTLNKSAKYKSPRTTACKAYMAKPDDGYYVVFDVKMVITKGYGSINPLYFTFVAPDGTTSEAIGGMFSGCGKPLDSGNELRAGTKRSGQLVFDVAAKTGSVEFGGSFFGGVQASWKV